MNYATHYDRLIARARNRPIPATIERHHVIPRCMGGANEHGNIVALTPAEHYVAHQLLVRIYPDVPGLATAAVRMAKQCAGNKAYEWLRRRHAEHVRAHRHSADTRARISAGLKGKPKPPRSEDHALKLMAAHKRPRSLESRMKSGSSMRGKRHSESTKAKISAGVTGVTRSAETRAKMAVAKLGNKHGVGHKLAPEKIAEMVAIRKQRRVERLYREHRE